MLVTKQHPFTGREVTLDLPITSDQMEQWMMKGRLAQDVFRNLNADQREFLISGIPPGEWNVWMGDDEY